MTTCLSVDLGLVGYAEAYALQRRVVAARKADAIADVLLLCEHPHVITQGRNGKREHLLAGENVLRQKSVDFHETSRGGAVFLVAACPQDLMHGAEREPAARQGPVDRHDIERQDAMACRPLDLADPITQRCEIGRL